MPFRDFFEEYKLQNKELFSKRSPLPFGLHPSPTFGILLLVVLIGGFVFVTCNKVIGIVILSITIITAISLFVYSLIYTHKHPSPSRDKGTSTSRINVLIALLIRYNISPDHTDKISNLIAYAQNEQQRYNPFSSLKKTLQTISIPVTAIISYTAGVIAEPLPLKYLVIIVLQLIGIIVVLALLAPSVYFIIESVVYPDKEHFQKLIDDLTQLLLFYPPINNHNQETA